MKEYAEELGWETIVDKKGEIDANGARYFEVKITPSGGKTSPEYLREHREKIMGFTISIIRDVLYKNQELEQEEFNKLTSTHITFSKDLKKVLVYTGNVLQIESPIKEFVELETKHYSLCDVAFGITLKWWKEEIQELLNASKFWFGRNKAEKTELQSMITRLEKLGI